MAYEPVRTKIGYGLMSYEPGLKCYEPGGMIYEPVHTELGHGLTGYEPGRMVNKNGLMNDGGSSPAACLPVFILVPFPIIALSETGRRLKNNCAYLFYHQRFTLPCFTSSKNLSAVSSRHCCMGVN